MPPPQKRLPYVPGADSYVGYTTGASKATAIKAYSGAIDSLVGIEPKHNHVIASRYHRDYSDLASNVSGRPGLTRRDYEYFRPGEAVATKLKQVIEQVNQAYKKVGLVRNMVDLMADFACQGIRLSHRNKRIEAFYRKWFVKVKGKNRSERFLNNFYRSGGIVISRKVAKLRRNSIDTFMKTIGSEDTGIKDIKLESGFIPIAYKFVNPLTVEPVGGELSIFLDEPQWRVKIPERIKTSSDRSGNKNEVTLPADIQRAIKGDGYLALNPNNTITFFYKKDDWELWGSPMLEAILDDIILLEKLRLADLAALDGAISNIRIFKLGSLEYKFMPTQNAASKLAEILESHMGVGTMDLVWGPDIELIESDTNVHEFLGEEKYRPTLQAIHGGLGIPGSLTGATGERGSTNNFISLKTLVERLNYGRDTVKEFWETEVELVQMAMGFRYPAVVEFDFPALSNEDAEKALLIQLSDRNLVSDETLHTRFGIADPELERIRLNREQKSRESGRSVPKSGPWHDPQFLNGLRKTALQLRMVTPSQVGLKLLERTDQKEIFMRPSAPKPILPVYAPPNVDQKLPDQPQKGRPKNSKDTKKRKQKIVNPQIKAAIELWADIAQAEIDVIVKPVILKYFNKASLRKLSAKQVDIFEKLKRGVLFSMEPFCDIDKDIVLIAIKSVNDSSDLIYNEWCGSISKEMGRKLTTEERRKVQSVVYSDLFLQE